MAPLWGYTAPGWASVAQRWASVAQRWASVALMWASVAWLMWIWIRLFTLILIQIRGTRLPEIMRIWYRQSSEPTPTGQWWVSLTSHLLKSARVDETFLPRWRVTDFYLFLSPVFSVGFVTFPVVPAPSSSASRMCWYTRISGPKVTLRKNHTLNIELDLQSLFGLHVCTAVLIGWDPFPRIWAHIRGRYWSAKIDDISL